MKVSIRSFPAPVASAYVQAIARLVDENGMLQIGISCSILNGEFLNKNPWLVPSAQEFQLDFSAARYWYFSWPGAKARAADTAAELEALIEAHGL